MPLLFLNEKSCGVTCDPDRADAAMADLVDAKWIGASPKNHVRWQRLLGLRNRSPVRNVFPEPDADGHLDYRHEGEVVQALGAAHFMDGVAVSLPVSREWQTSEVSIERSELVELADEILEFEHETVAVRHISALPHVEEHLGWIRESSLARAVTGRQIWERRSDLYPSLQFLPLTEAQFSNLDARWVVPVRRCLERLDAAAAAWDPATAHELAWRTKVTPEGETRKRVCRFETSTGSGRRFTSPPASRRAPAESTFAPSGKTASSASRTSVARSAQTSERHHVAGLLPASSLRAGLKGLDEAGRRQVGQGDSTRRRSARPAGSSGPRRLPP